MAIAQVLDRYGNNAAVLCGFCSRAFIVSQLLNKKNGSSCPHCAKDKVSFNQDGQIHSIAQRDRSDQERQVHELLALVKPLAAEFYRLTGKPLGVTGEIAEFAASSILGLVLTPARTIGYDAIRGSERIEIKGRAFGSDAKPSQRMSRIKLDAPCDTVLLVLLDNTTLDPHEIWEAPYKKVCEVLSRPGSKSRERGALGVPAFKAIATRVWNCQPKTSLLQP